MNTSQTSSDLLRKQLRLQRQSLSPTQQTQHAQLAQQHLAHFLATTTLLNTKKQLNIAFFLAQDGELPTNSAIQYLWHTSPHKVWLPILKTTPPEHKATGHMAFAEYTPNTPMKKNNFAILEPDLPQNRWISGDALDLVLMPLVGFDTFGNRMGMGGGYYDRTFQFKQQSTKITPLLIGWAHSCQQVKQLPVNSWDIPLDGVITEAEILNFSPLSFRI